MLSRIPVHPHVRGDNIVCIGEVVRYYRFTPTCVGTMAMTRTPGGPLTRFTPTCVGTMDPESIAVGIWPVHPHVRGDNSFIIDY